MTVADIDDVLALSPLQLGLYSHATLIGPDGEDPYVIAMTADVTGPLDVTLLRDCASAMLVRHPNLRASFWHQDLPRPVQIVPSSVELPWQQVRADDDQAAALEKQERGRPFTLDAGPLIRFLLIELPEARWRLVVTAHHIVIDGWSLPVFIGEMLTLYRSGGNPDTLPPPRLYRDYIGWLADRDLRVGERIWRRHLAGMPGPTLLSPALGGDGTGLPKRTELTLPAADAERLAAAAGGRGVTLNTLLQMAWALILSRLTDRDDVVFGVTVSGRPPELTGVETMVGLFINTIPLRVRLNPNTTVGGQCSALQRDAAELRDHSHLTHSQLRSFAGVGEMFDTLLVYESFPSGGMVGGQEFMAGRVSFRPAAMESLTHFPVTIAAYRADAELTLLVEVTDNALGVSTAETLGRRVLQTMSRLIDMWDRPLGAVVILLDGEVRPIASMHPGTASQPGVPERFADTAVAHSDSTALRWDGGQLTYRELHERSDRLAGLLAESRAHCETAVAIRLPRGADYVVAMLGVLKAGGMYVPLEPGMPAGRVDSILAQTGAALVIDEDTMAAARTAPRIMSPTVPGQAAYVVFTSGTTGEPKGVIGTHQALLAYVDDHAERMLRPAADRLGRPLRIGHAWSFAFDAAWQPLAGLLYGHTVHLIDETDRRDPEALVDIIDRHGIDLLDVTPSLFTNLRRAGLLDRGTLQVLALGGEAVGSVDWTDIRKACTHTLLAAHNCYGPTETTVEAVVAAIADHDAPVIGYPTRSTTAVVLDSWLHPVPDGVVGELYLAGEQVTRGYLGRPAETATRFVAAPGGARMYRTGDLVRRDRDGALAFIGRADAQIQVRGHRVEPGEIEAVLAEVPGVRHAHVAVHRQATDLRLIAYVVGEVAATDLRSLLRNRLPRYMMPHRLVVVEAIPLTANGKVDEAALAAAATPDETPELPVTATEVALGQAVGELLGIAEVDVDADLLELGLDSIVALSLVQAARRSGLPLRARLVLECGTLRELAAAVDRDSAGELAAVPEPQGPIPALPAVHWLYEHGDPRRLAQIEAITLPADATAERLRRLLDGIAAGHEMFRSRLDLATMTFLPADSQTIPLTAVEVTGELGDAVTELTGAVIDRLDPERGHLTEALWLHRPDEAGVLVLAAHVLAMDPASWRIVLGELMANWSVDGAGLVSGERVSYRRWAHSRTERAAELDTVEFWLAQLDGDDPVLGDRRIRPGADRFADLAITLSVTEADITGALLRAQTPIQDVLADACARLITCWRDQRGQSGPIPLVALETHGRNGADDTVGLLSAIYPLRIRPGEPLPEIAGEPTDYAMLRYLRPDTAERLRGFRGPQVLLNYLGRLDLDAGSLLDRGLLAHVPIMTEPNVAVRHELTLVAAVAGGKLVTQWRTVPDIFSDTDVAALQSIWQDVLRELAEVSR
ncbi:amino acid adenylation domain-containing protein [Mycobacterium sp. CVI_P3]|uniref:Amino acid adenylation domain-containing protein n=1 Tax=Mycobacterium pinniadriaticum TaxID=2994102 RepID=A0ABT3SHP4_9MYCO|nr:amino acid adenylation domain-containing protein [Mycobacterium pinniadriaticum]MCX2932578.1 amino acid adenylation domain-containing protein [Mycobacterium pinniadriaticum]MCX2938978.1 amino acid adenylation domain-containing protein [Mycobacterium pinniadriaticum]